MPLLSRVWRCYRVFFEANAREPRLCMALRGEIVKKRCETGAEPRGKEAYSCSTLIDRATSPPVAVAYLRLQQKCPCAFGAQ